MATRGRTYQQILFDFVLNTNKYLTDCDDKDVISFNSNKWLSISKIKKVIHQSFAQSGIDSVRTHTSNNCDYGISHHWFLEGEECEILRAGSKGWQKGKIKINVTLEFVPDEPKDKSPLDDVRQELERDNS